MSTKPLDANCNMPIPQSDIFSEGLYSRNASPGTDRDLEPLTSEDLRSLDEMERNANLLSRTAAPAQDAAVEEEDEWPDDLPVASEDETPLAELHTPNRPNLRRQCVPTDKAPQHMKELLERRKHWEPISPLAELGKKNITGKKRAVSQNVCQDDFSKQRTAN